MNKRGRPDFSLGLLITGDDHYSLCSQPPSAVSQSVNLFLVGHQILTRPASYVVRNINSLQAKVIYLAPYHVFGNPIKPPITPTITKRGSTGILATASGSSDSVVSGGWRTEPSS